MTTAESLEILLSRSSDCESLYDAGTYILGLNDQCLSETQRNFKRCYDLWLGLGNGFSSVCNGTYLSSLPRGVATFERIGATTIAIPGRLVLAEFESRNISTTEDEISDFTLDDSEVDPFHRAIEKIDADYLDRIWDTADDVERRLILLASGQSQ
ncbi:MAG: hypothetical protein AAF357_07195 [Verrucomicrobiota bacterium]